MARLLMIIAAHVAAATAPTAVVAGRSPTAAATRRERLPGKCAVAAARRHPDLKRIQLRKQSTVQANCFPISLTFSSTICFAFSTLSGGPRMMKFFSWASGGARLSIST